MKRVLLLVAALLMAASGAYAELIGSHEGGEFDGSTVAVDTEIEVGMVPGDEYSISGWITTTSGEGWIFGVANCGEDGVYGGNSNGLYMDGGGYTYDMWWVGATGTGDQGLNDGEIHHVAYTLDADGNVLLYVDGAEVGDGSGFDWPEHEPAGVYTTVTLGFSGEADGEPGDDACDVGVGDDSWPGAFTGTIESVLVYDHALTAGEVSDLFDAGPGEPAPDVCYCVYPDGADVGDTVTVILCANGEPVDLSGDAFAEIIFVSVYDPWTEVGVNTDDNPEVFETGNAVFEITAEMIPGDGWGWVWMDSGPFYEWMPFDNVDFQAGGTCDPCCVQIGVSVAGSHRLTVGDDLSLTSALTGVVADSYQWTKDGEDLEGETGSELVIVDAQLEDSGVYTVVVDDGAGGLAEFESDDFLVVVMSAEAPLAGGLGLGLLAGACALAGVVAIRRKK